MFPPEVIVLLVKEEPVTPLDKVTFPPALIVDVPTTLVAKFTSPVVVIVEPANAVVAFQRLNF